jgi:hypothetical protein
LEDLPKALLELADGRAKNRFDPATAPRSPRGYVAGTPRDTLEAIREKLLKALAPSVKDGVYLYSGCDRDIADSPLDLIQKVALKWLFWLCADSGKWWAASASHREETILRLVEWPHELGVAAASRDSATAAEPVPANGSHASQSDTQSVPRKASINARMLETIQKNHEARGWGCKRWAEHLKCAKSSVVETQTWKTLSTLRDRERAERARDRRRRPRKVN